MKKRYITLCLSYCLFLFTVCEKDVFEGVSTLDTTPRTVAPFTKIKVGSVIEVFIEKSDQQSVVIETNSNLTDQVLTTVNQNTLEVSLKKGNYKNITVRIYIKVPHIEKLEFEDSSNGHLIFQTETLALELSGSAEVTLEGSANTLNTELKNAGILHGYLFPKSVVNTKSEDASLMEINCIDALNGKVSEAAKVYYRGTPTFNVELTEGGSVLSSN